MFSEKFFVSRSGEKGSTPALFRYMQQGHIADCPLIMHSAVEMLQGSHGITKSLVSLHEQQFQISILQNPLDKKGFLACVKSAAPVSRLRIELGDN